MNADEQPEDRDRDARAPARNTCSRPSRACPATWRRSAWRLPRLARPFAIHPRRRARSQITSPARSGRDARLGEVAQDRLEAARLAAFRGDASEGFRRPLGGRVQALARRRVGVRGQEQEGELAVEGERAALRHLLHLDPALAALAQQLAQVPLGARGALRRGRVENGGAERRDHAVVEAHLDAGLAAAAAAALPHPVRRPARGRVRSRRARRAGLRVGGGECGRGECGGQQPAAAKSASAATH